MSSGGGLSRPGMDKPSFPIWILLCGFVAYSLTKSPIALSIACFAALYVGVFSIGTLSRAAKLLIALCVVATIAGFWLERLSWAQLLVSIERGLLLAVFILSLGMLVFAASRSDIVAKVGANLARQPPGKRYWALCVGSGLLGPMLSVSVVSLLNAAVQTDLRKSGHKPGDKAYTIITRRTATAIMRGMSIVPLWSPISITIILVETRIPDLRWMDYLPLGLFTAILMIVMGWGLDKLTFSALKANFAYQHEFDWRPIGWLVLILSFVPLCAGALSDLTAISFTEGLIFAFVVISLFWVGCQEIVTSDMLGSLKRYSASLTAMNDRLSRATNEATLLFAAGALSGILYPLVDVDEISVAIENSNVPAEMLLVAAVVIMILLVNLGISSVVSAAIVLDLFLNTPSLQVEQSLLVLSVTLAFGIGAISSPIGVGVLLTVREIGVSANRVAYVWNANYALTAVGIFTMIAFFQLYT
ncbi:hypothetical protein IMCC3135_16915 [Granulosicoccus antarcticus IMCC3135]|uniref:Citrate transporter-like domain-containing protein n=2 Tax=Granulosicoccus TaxID=437504 RepID=A0A2Z2NSI3_9GAMM|nr:hypothetical protein IMCC3135_16915 [Granulosicoccus antarcticus IMCC3135]